MTDTATPEAEMNAELEKIVADTKRGFDLKARLKNRGLRKATLTLFLDDEKGAELGWAHDLTDALGNVVGREQEGVVGELELAQQKLEDWLNNKGHGDRTQEEIDGHRVTLANKVIELEAQRDELIAELTKTAIVVKLCAVPPKIQKDCHR